MREQDMVREFHKAFGSDIQDQAYDSLSDYPDSLIDLRNSLVQEEADEVYGAIWRDDDLASLVKELCDLLYVIYGTGVALGVDLHEAFKVVHASNMSKAGPNGQVEYRDDGKVMKSEWYQDPDMELELARQRISQGLSQAMARKP